MSGIKISQPQWLQAFDELGWASPLPEQTWQRLGGGTETLVDWPDVYNLIHGIGWSDQHAKTLWVHLQPQEKSTQSIPESADHASQAGAADDCSQPASWRPRILAAIIDGVIWGIPCLAVSATGVLLMQGGKLKQKYDPVTHLASFDFYSTIAAAIPVMLVALLVPLAYNYFFMSRQGEKHGQTPGKQIMKVRIVDEDGGAVSNAAIIMRSYVGQGILWSLASLLMVVVFGTFGIFLALFYTAAWWVAWPKMDDSNRCPHDLVAKTKLVQA